MCLHFLVNSNSPLKLCHVLKWAHLVSNFCFFLAQEVVDVIRRYTNSYKDVLGRRNLVPESWLQEYLISTNNQIRSYLSPQQRAEVESQANEESKQLKELETKVRQISTQETEGRISGKNFLEKKMSTRHIEFKNLDTTSS